MRRLRPLLFAITGALGLVHGAPSFAQYGGGQSPDQQQQEEDAQRKKRDEEFGVSNAPIPQLRNAGPCPFVKVLYDAARTIEFKDNVVASASVIYSGEIEKIASVCAYRGAEPIKVTMQILFELGRGPRAPSSRKTYRYWVAVTDRNRAVLDKQWFDLPVTFPTGQDRVTLTQTINPIIIPRHDSKVSGGNFEILAGFEITPQMADFNRQGKRFRANAGQAGSAAAAPAPQ